MRNYAFQIWNYGVRSTMYELPIPLAGHCVVVINNKFVVFLGGGNKYVFLNYFRLPNFLRHNQIQS